MSISGFGNFANVITGSVSNIPGAAITANVTTAGTAVDCLQSDDDFTHAVVASGATTVNGGTTETYVFAIYESDTSGGTYTAISGATGSITAANTVLIISTRQRTKRYVKLYLTVAGTSPSIVYSGSILNRYKLNPSNKSGTQL